MAKNMRAETDESDVATTGDRFEAKLVAFAEQLGTLVGTIQGKAEGWLDRRALANEIGRIRDSASELLAHVTPAARTKTPPPPAAAPRVRQSRGQVDAPGKRHRKPPPQQRIDKKMGEPRGKQMGQKGAKIARRGGRG